jgi:hypothetical protein
MKTSVLLALSTVCVVTVAGAQEPRLDAWVFGGASLFNFTEGFGDVSRGGASFQIRRRFDTSPLGGVGAGYRVGPRAHVDVSVAVVPWRRLGTRLTGDFFFVPIEIEREVVSVHGSVTGRYDLGPGPTRPYLAAGFGRIHHTVVDDLPYGGSEWDWAVVIGGGLERGLGSRLRGRVEILDHVVPDHLGTEHIGHDVHLRLGVGLRF